MTDPPSDRFPGRFTFKVQRHADHRAEIRQVYYFSIKGINSAGVSPWSIVTSIRARVSYPDRQTELSTESDWKIRGVR